MPEPTAFDPNKHMTKIQGKDYLEAKWRLVWFRQEHPEGIITTRLVEHNPEERYAIVHATVSIPGRGSADGLAMHAPTSKAADYVANAETSAIARAVAALGYGTQFARELDEPEQLADSPVQRPTKPSQPTPTASEADRARLLRAATKVEFSTEACRDELLRRSGQPRTATVPASIYQALAKDLEDVASGDADLRFDPAGAPVFQRGAPATV